MKEEFETLETGSTEEKPVENTNTDNEKIFSDVFSGFPPPSETIQLTPSETINKSESEKPSNESWQGNPLYYQSGKKVGTLKPSAGARKESAPVKPVEPPAPLGMPVSGAMLMTLADVLIPNVIVGINNWTATSKDEKVKVKDVKLTATQKDDYGPVFKECADFLKLHMHPLFVLGVMVSSAYSTNLGLAKAKKKEDEK